MKVLRYSAIAAVAIFAAACGDKVTVAGPTAVTLTSTTTTTTTTTPVAPGKINSIAVAPAAVTLTIGQAVTLVAAVNADPGIATTVTWSSSDATKASVSTAGLVTALAATPGVAICATSTVNVGVKGCASAVVVAASATVPATASIAGVYVTNVSTPVTPSNVSGSLFVTVNVEPGTETISKVYLKIGTVVADSQVFSAAQSAALRNAVETANETGAQAAGENMANATSTIMLTANTAAYNATTGAVSYANGSATLSVQLFVAGNTAARSTATYSSNLTLNNGDVAYATYTYPSTKTTATDPDGYAWTGFGGGSLTVRVIPVLYSGKTLSNATVKFGGVMSGISKTASGGGLTSNYCDVADVTDATCTTLTNTDTLVTKTTTASGAFDVLFALHDRNYNRPANSMSTVVTPKVSMTFTDGTSSADADFENASTLAARFDNKGPGQATLAKVAANGSLTYLRGNVSFGLRILTSGVDTTDLVTVVGADSGVSAGASLTELRGNTFTVYRNAGGTGVTLTDTLQTMSVNHGTTADISALSEAGYYCYRVTQTDALGNPSIAGSDAQVKVSAKIGKKCATEGNMLYALMDKTLPVMTWASTSWSQGDTAVTAGVADADQFWTATETNADTTRIRVTKYTASGSTITAAIHNALSTTTTTAGDTYVVYAPYGGVENLISTASTKWASSAEGAGLYRINVKHKDDAGNESAVITKYIVVDGAAPSTPSTPAVASTTLGVAAAVNAYATDELDLKASALTISTVGLASGGTATIYGSVITSGPAHADAVLEETPAAINASLGAMASTRFLNVAISGTGSIQYLAPLQHDQSVGTLGQITYGTGSSGVALAAVNNGFRTKFALRAYDQAGRTAISSYAAGQIADSITAIALTSRYALIGNGLISGADSTEPGTGTKNTIGSTINTALTTGAVTATYLNTIPLKMSLTQYKYWDRTGNLLRTTAAKQASKYCAANAAGSSLTMLTSAEAESEWSSVGALSSDYSPAQNTAPTVYVYAPLAGAASWGYVGSMGTPTATTTTGSAGYCDDTVTRVYSYSWVITSRAPYTQWSNGSLLYVAVGTMGQATIVRGPYVYFKP